MTVFAQSTIQDSCICYTEIQDIRCLECLVNSPKKDSVIFLLKMNAADYIEALDGLEQQKSIISDYNAQLKSDNTTLQKKVGRLKKGKRINLMIGFAGGLGSALLINALIP